MKCLTQVTFHYIGSPCSSAPCHNDGECINKGNSFKCVCPPGFKGRRCQQRGSQKINHLNNYLLYVIASGLSILSEFRNSNNAT